MEVRMYPKNNQSPWVGAWLVKEMKHGVVRESTHQNGDALVAYLRERIQWGKEEMRG